MVNEADLLHCPDKSIKHLINVLYLIYFYEYNVCANSFIKTINVNKKNYRCFGKVVEIERNNID